MAVLNWQTILTSPDYVNTVREAEMAAARQFKAIPSADPGVRQAALSEGARLTRLQDIGGRLGLEQQRLDLGERDLALQERGFNRFASRLPLANLLSIGGAGIGALSAFANLRQIRRQEQAFGQLSQRQDAAALARQRELQSLTELTGQLTPLYQQHLQTLGPGGF